MKNIIKIFILCLAFVPTVSNAYFFHRRTAGGGGYSDVTFYWGAESTTAEKSPGDNTATFSSANLEISATQAAVGTNSLRVFGQGTANFDVTAKDILDHGTFGVGFFLYPITTPLNSVLFYHYYDDNNRVFIQYNATQIRLIYYGQGAAQVAAVTKPATDAWVYVEAQVDITGNLAGGAKLRICLDNTTCASNTNALTALGNDPANVRFGNVENLTIEYYMDQMMITDDPANRSLYALRNETSL